MGINEAKGLEGTEGVRTFQNKRTSCAKALRRKETGTFEDLKSLSGWSRRRQESHYAGPGSSCSWLDHYIMRIWKGFKQEDNIFWFWFWKDCSVCSIGKIRIVVEYQLGSYCNSTSMSWGGVQGSTVKLVDLRAIWEIKLIDIGDR